MAGGVGPAMPGYIHFARSRNTAGLVSEFGWEDGRVSDFGCHDSEFRALGSRAASLIYKIVWE